MLKKILPLVGIVPFLRIASPLTRTISLSSGSKSPIACSTSILRSAMNKILGRRSSPRLFQRDRNSFQATRKRYRRFYPYQSRASAARSSPPDIAFTAALMAFSLVVARTMLLLFDRAQLMLRIDCGFMSSKSSRINHLGMVTIDELTAPVFISKSKYLGR